MESVHTSLRKFRTCHGPEVLFLGPRHSKDLYRVPGPPIYEDWWTGDWWSFEELPHPWFSVMTVSHISHILNRVFSHERRTDQTKLSCSRATVMTLLF